MGKLDGKIALVTGASKGIGAGIALSLAKEGAAVAVNYASDREGADRVAEKIKAAGRKASAVHRSVTSSEEIDRFFNETETPHSFMSTSQPTCQPTRPLSWRDRKCSTPRTISKQSSPRLHGEANRAGCW
jgi:NAD(P)-dependent dehydrogenase (short-subunit alcohol dehydrogenase family)